MCTLESHGADLLGAGAEAAEEILSGVFRIEKALDPLEPDGFMAIVRRLGRALRGAARPAEDDALRRAIERLDVDWPNLSTEARDQVVRAARQALKGVEVQVLPSVDHVFEVEGERVVGTTRRSAARRMGLRVSADLSSTDERIASFVRESQGNFVRDEYGRRREAFTQRAKEIVASGMERGLGREDIVGELVKTMGAEAFDRSRDYWEVVSMVFTNRARTATQLSTYEEAGIETFRFEAVLDEVTSEVCRFMHGKEFTVSRAMDRFKQVGRARDPERIRDIQPFVQVGADRDGHEVLFYERGGRRRAVAQVDESAVGEADSIGRYSRALGNQQLEAAGLSVPPLHGRCRSTIVASQV